MSSSNQERKHLWDEYYKTNPNTWPTIVNGGPLRLGTLAEAIGEKAAAEFFANQPEPDSGAIADFVAERYFLQQLDLD